MIYGCKKCGALKQKNKCEIKKGTNAYVYRDENGLKWHGKLCNDCDRERIRLIGHKSGKHLPRSMSKDPRHIKAYMAEVVIKNFFEENGYYVKQSLSNGPDLILSKGSKTLTCEVKCAVKEKKSNYRYVEPVLKTRMADDLIAIVSDNGKFFIEPMEVHLSKCTKSGTRNIGMESKLFLFY